MIAVKPANDRRDLTRSSMRAMLVFRRGGLEIPMAVTQSEKAERFRALHDAGRPFVIPNAWDGG